MRYPYAQARLYDPQTLRFSQREGVPVRLPAHSSVLRQLMGLGGPKVKLPREGTGMVMVQGVELWVEPRVSYGPRRAHRLMCACPHCGATMSAGRLNQHVC